MLTLILSLAAAGAAAQDRPLRFWNLTAHTIASFHLAPAGSNQWGPNQCLNDRDGTVDVDERLRITDISPGIYDARLSDVSGRQCTVRNLKIEAGAIFSIEEKELADCTR
jgi:hypothetical protein